MGLRPEYRLPTKSLRLSGLAEYRETASLLSRIAIGWQNTQRLNDHDSSSVDWNLWPAPANLRRSDKRSRRHR
jgi:hypothetical protein